MSRFVTGYRRFLGWMALGVVAAETLSATEPSQPMQLVIVARQAMRRLQLEVEVDGQPVAEVWDETFARLHKFSDRDSDGRLQGTELARLPSTFWLRQMLWSPGVPFSGSGPALEDLDRDHDSAVTSQEVAAFYRRKGLGNILIGVGVPPSTNKLTSALLTAIDQNADGSRDEGEWRGMAALVKKLDQNDDELIGPGELVPRIAYPGATGTTLLRPASAEQAWPGRNVMPLLLLNDDDTDWADILAAHRDADRDGRLNPQEAGLSSEVFVQLDNDKSGELTGGELAHWINLKPDLVWYVRLSTQANGKLELAEGFGLNADWLRVDLGASRTSLHACQGVLPETWATARKRTANRLAEADLDRDSFVGRTEIEKPDLEELRQLLTTIDRNADDQLGRDEIAEWQSLLEQVVRGQVLLTVLDHGCGLYELLDANHDGSLSMRELRGAPARVDAAGCLTNGVFDPTKLPRQVVMTMSLGHPDSPIGAASRSGPEWFAAMDRNGDGDVSRREFLHGDEPFKKLDRDGDGLLGSAEAQKMTVRSD